MKAITFTATGSKATSETALDKTIFEVTPKSNDLIAQAYETARHNSRTINALTKTRGNVRGGGKKPWKQKGTGRARAGTIRSPIWRGGGITFGPTGELRAKKISKGSKNVALKQALSLALKAGKVKVIAEFNPKDGKTKQATDIISKMDLKGSVLIVLNEFDQMVKRSTNNIPSVQATDAMRINVVEVVDYDNIVFTKKSLDVLSKRLGAKDE